MEGGTTVTVTGRALANDLHFVFGSSGGSVATKLSCPSSTKCTMATPAHAPGTVDVIAETPWGYGYSPITAADRFTYQGPAITSFSPSVGPTTGGLLVALNGVGLQNGNTTVSFGGADATGVYCVGTTYCSMTSPPHAAGSVHLTVTVNGITSALSSAAFTFVVFPTITGISPGTANAGTTVTLTGTGFSTASGKTAFNFFGNPVNGTCTSTTQCTAVVPGEVTQYTDVTVTVNGLTSLDSVQFGYPLPPPPPPCKGTTCS